MESSSQLSQTVRWGRFTSKQIFLFILSGGFLIRLAVSLGYLPRMHKDSYDYFSQADILLSGGYENFFPNGYPFIIALCKMVGGNAVVDLLALLNVIMSGLSIYFIYRLAKAIFNNEHAGLIAALIMAFFPSQINYTRWLTTEVPAMFFMLGGFYYYVVKKQWLSGLFFGIAVIVRTEILPIVLVLLVVDTFHFKRLNIAFIATLLLPIIFTGSYCYAKTGVFALSGHGTVNILTSVTASGGDIDWSFDDNHPEIKTSKQALALYFDYFKENPAGFLKARFMNFWEMWGYPSDMQGSRGTGSRLVIAAGNFFLLICGISAWWVNRKKFNVLIMLIPFVVITGIHIVMFTMQRYTYPVEPFMILLSAWTLTRIFQTKKLFPDLKA
jgi:4-amino-4-deoxy-L-arabinose transferase-like glycosyltransferase